MPPDGNFQDYVVLSQDTLSHKGAALQVGTTSASTVTFGLSNSAGMLAVAAAPTANATLWLSGSGTLLTDVNVSAGTTSQNLSAFVLSNSNNVSFGLSGSTITASATVGSSQASINLSAGTTSNLASAFTFSNSNGVSFGLNASTLTASIATSLTAVNLSAGTTSQNLSAFVLSNSNNVSFGLSGSTVTATASVASTQASINLSAGTTSNLASAFTFSNSNGVSFGLNASTVTASVATSLTAVNLSAGTTSQNLSAFVLSNSNNVSFGLSGSTVTATATVASTQASINLSAGTTSNLASAFTFSNSNNVSFGLNASTITASIATSLTAINLSAGTTSQNLSNFVFSNSNGVSFGLSGSTITATVTPGAAAGIGAIQAGTQTATSGTVIFSNSNSVNFGMSGSSQITASITPGDLLASNLAVFSSEATNGSSGAAATINWNNGNKQTITLSAATVTLSFTAPSFSGAGTFNAVLRLVQDGTGGRTVSWTGGGLVINWVGGVPPVLSTAANAVDIISLYYNGTSWYGSYGIGFGTSSVAVPVLTNINVSAGTTSNNLSAFTLSNSNGMSFGLNASTITAQDGANMLLAAGTQTAATGSTVVFSNSNAITFGMSASSIVTAQLGGMSSWANGDPVASFSGTSNGFFSLNPNVIPYNLTATNCILLAAMTGPAANSSAGVSFSLGVYTQTGAGSAGTLSRASSTTSAFTWTSASTATWTGTQYFQISLNSWAFTAGLYVFALNAATINSASLTLFGPISGITLASGLGSLLRSMALPGLTQASSAGLPASLGISNTSGYIRTGSSAYQQPWMLLQGT